MESGLSASDVLAMTRDQDCNGMWNNPFIYLVWLAVLGGGFYGNRGYGYGDNAAVQGAITRSDLFEGFNNQDVNGQLRGITNGLCDGFYAVNNSLLTGFSGVGERVLENRFAAQQCCCDLGRNIDAVRYENAKNTCDIITANNMNTRDILEAQNAGTQRIIDYLTKQEIDTLRSNLQAAQFTLANNAQTNAIIGAVRPFPQPAYITCSPYTSAAANNCGCGI